MVFDAAGFQLEVWLCGVNRPAGRRWAGALKDCPPPIQWAGEHPADWLARLPVQADLADGDAAAAAVLLGTAGLRGGLLSERFPWNILRINWLFLEYIGLSVPLLSPSEHFLANFRVDRRWTARYNRGSF